MIKRDVSVCRDSGPCSMMTQQIQQKRQEMEQLLPEEFCNTKVADLAAGSPLASNDQFLSMVRDETVLSMCCIFACANVCSSHPSCPATEKLTSSTTEDTSAAGATTDIPEESSSIDSSSLRMEVQTVFFLIVTVLFFLQ